MKNFKNVNTLIFDLGGVLINLDLNQCILNFKQLGLENVEQYLGKFGQSGFFMQFEKGDISAIKFRNEIRKLTPNLLTDAQIDKAWCSFLLDIPAEKLHILAELRKKFRLVLLSNTNIIHFPNSDEILFTKTGKRLTDYFDKCYLSYEMKMVKPDKEIFENILSSENVQANECLFLDDGLKNIEQAQELGIQTYLVSEREDLSFLLNTETWE
ncbi:MAG: HAD family phosphatase [Bacteroidota bacterium]|nr:HAD family phosphatase [Bacteroidota bacterium]